MRLIQADYRSHTVWEHLGLGPWVDQSCAGLHLARNHEKPTHKLRSVQSKTEEKTFEKQKTDRMLSIDVIEAAQAKCVSQLAPVQHKWTFPVSVDNRKLNALTTLDSYQILSLENCVCLLRHTKIFSGLDQNSRHWKFKPSNNDCARAAFASQGLFGFTQMPFPLKDVPGPFQTKWASYLRTASIRLALLTLRRS